MFREPIIFITIRMMYTAMPTVVLNLISSGHSFVTLHISSINSPDWLAVVIHFDLSIDSIIIIDVICRYVIYDWTLYVSFRHGMDRFLQNKPYFLLYSFEYFILSLLLTIGNISRREFFSSWFFFFPNYTYIDRSRQILLSHFHFVYNNNWRYLAKRDVKHTRVWDNIRERHVEKFDSVRWIWIFFSLLLLLMHFLPKI